MEKKKFKMPSSFTVLFIIIAIMAALTWVIPAGQYQVDENGNNIPGTYEQVESTPQGVWDVFSAPIEGVLGTETTSGAIEVMLFVLVIGGFLGVVAKTGAIDAGIGGIVTRYQGREKKLIPILMFVFALGGTTFGMAEETMAFYGLIIPIMIVAGFDTLVAVSVVMLGAGIGVMCSTVNPFATGVASGALGISIADGMGWRILLFIISYIVSVTFVMRYATKVEQDKRNSLVYATYEADKAHFAMKEDIPKATGTQKAVLGVFIGTFVFMIMSLIPWDMFGLNFFVNLNEAVHSTILGDIIGQSALPIGWWYFVEITILFLVASIIVKFVARMKEEEFIDAFLDGARDLLGVALIIGLARGIQVIMNDGQIIATFLYWGELLLSDLGPAMFGIITYLFFIPMSFLIPSTSGLASATMPIIGGLAQFAGVASHVVVTAFQSASGIVNLIAPTSAVVMGSLAIARIPYGTWIKYIWKLIAILFFINMFVVAIAAVVSS